MPRVFLLTIALGAISTAAFSGQALYKKQDCNKFITQPDLNACADANYAAADAALNTLYKNLVSAETDAKGVTRLKESERAWVTYRDKECDREAAPEEGGSIWSMEMSGCLEEKAKARICELRSSGDISMPSAGCP